ncbi:hypothetical protein OHB04_05425 [Streptomyces sp. NBC_01775]|uniref:hypothetical protein n=1 Tax=Streptomyces sp. NBC_01775 TaxID=2975939 RepID=UPI002DDAD735|nr:hypothetical protein [Streptomyces sp. NBC_01775]WSB75275.1 hypothetical protein OHB04_05425 [Streptomyces sp. NBC_01775]
MPFSRLAVWATASAGGHSGPVGGGAVGGGGMGEVSPVSGVAHQWTPGGSGGAGDGCAVIHYAERPTSGPADEERAAGRRAESDDEEGMDVDAARGAAPRGRERAPGR